MFAALSPFSYRLCRLFYFSVLALWAIVLILFTFAVLSFYSCFYVIRLTWALFTYFLILHFVCYAFYFSLWDFCLFSAVSVMFFTLPFIWAMRAL